MAYVAENISSPSVPSRIDTSTLIELRNVVKTFKTGAGDFEALKNINLIFHQGEFTSIMGKSGSGKSTLINMITGIDHPTTGSVRVGDTYLHRMKEGQLAVWRGRTMGIVFQFFQLLPTLTVLENTMLPMDFCNMYPLAEREGRAMALLNMLELDNVYDKLPAALSGGQQQIAAIARALANDPPIIIADEPTGNLDSRSAEHILQIFSRLADQNKTILIVTHDQSLAKRSNRRVLISDGELIHEVIAQAMTMLTHPQMLRITHQVTNRRYEPESTLAHQGAVDEGLYIITKGVVDIVRHSRFSSPKVVGQLKPGGYFSELELVETRFCDLTFKAAPHNQVEALCLSLDHFHQLVNESRTTSNLLRQAAVSSSAQFCPQDTRKRGRRQ